MHDLGGPTPDRSLIGGRYALGELLGVGGTGSVFAATDIGGGTAPDPSTSSGTGAGAGSGTGAGAGAEVAVKLLHPHLCADEASRDAFLREARHAIALDHPNIVRVHAAGLYDAAGMTMPWIALDLLHGPTLRDWVDKVGPLSVQEAAAIADGLLAGLAAAHAAGIVHRDISPQNIILQGALDRPRASALTADMVRIVDFGLADVTGRSTIGVDVLLAADAAASGQVVGNAAFMSPEQAQGRPVRSVSDLYQAGAVLYFALTGRAPFPRETTAQVMQAHVNAPPPVPSALAPGARSLDRIVTRAMAKTPAHRFRDAAEFRAAVAAAVPADAGDASSRFARSAGGVRTGSAAGSAGGSTAAFESARSADGPGEGDAPTRLLPSGGAGEPLGYLSPAASGPPDAPQAPNRTAGGLAAGIVGVVILALAGWAVVAAAAAPGESPTPSPSASSAPPVVESAPPSPTPSTVPSPSGSPVASEVPVAPIDVPVPALHGSLADADSALRAGGLALGTVTRVESAEAADRVLAQNPAAGERLAPGATVHVTVASGTNVVPQVTGMTLASATAMLQSAGFVASADRFGAPASTIVTTSQPGSGAVLRVGVTVTLVLAPAQTPTPAPTDTDAPAEGER